MEDLCLQFFFFSSKMYKHIFGFSYSFRTQATLDCYSLEIEDCNFLPHPNKSEIKGDG